MRSPATRRCVLRAISILLIAAGVLGVVGACSTKEKDAARSRSLQVDAAMTDVPTVPLPEYRAVFVTTAFNIDWPSKPELHWRTQRDEINAIVQRVADMKCNVIILQVRAFGDRIHRGHAKKEPWAEPLNLRKDPHEKGGKEKKYDPLAEWIDAAHRRGIELHVWVNPFRVDGLVEDEVENPQTKLKEKRQLHVMKNQDETYLWLNPNSLATHDYLIEVIEELLNYKDKEVMQRVAAGDAPPMARPALVSSAAGAWAMLLMADQTDGGPDGVIIDHHLPGGPPPDPGWPPSTHPSGAADGPADVLTAAAEDAAASLAAQIQAPTATAGQAEPELDDSAMGRKKKRIRYLMKKRYGDVALQPNETDIHTFIQRLFLVCDRAEVKLGLSPKEDDKRAMAWMERGWAHYMVPELYTPEKFAANLKVWNDKNTFNNPGQRWVDVTDRQRKPLMVPGLYTTRVQSPASNSDDSWDADVIKSQAAAAREQAKGHAHYSWGALRTRSAGGPPDNVGDELKAGLYAAPALLPPARSGNAFTSVPAVTFAQPKVTWLMPAAADRPRVRFWAVWSRSANGWSEMQVVSAKQTWLTIGGDVDRVAVKAIDGFNRVSEFGVGPATEK